MLNFITAALVVLGSAALATPVFAQSAGNPTAAHHGGNATRRSGSCLSRDRRRAHHACRELPASVRRDEGELPRNAAAARVLRRSQGRK